MEIIVGIAFLYLVVILVLDFFGVSSQESAVKDNVPEAAGVQQLD